MRLWHAYVVKLDKEASRTAPRAELHAWIARQPGMRIESETQLVWEDPAAWMFVDVELAGGVSAVRVSVLEKLGVEPALSLATRIADHLMWRVWDESVGQWRDPGWFRRGEAHAQAGEYEKAVAAYRTGAEAREPDWLLSLFNLGHTLLHRLDRPREALTAFEEYRRQSPDDWMGVFQIGNALSQLGMKEEALAKQREAVMMDGDAADAWFNIAELHLQLGEPAKALEVLDDQVARLSPDDTGLHYNRACAYALLGNKDEALVHLAKAIAIAPDEYREKSPKDRDLVSLLEDPRFLAMIRG